MATAPISPPAASRPDLSSGGTPQTGGPLLSPVLMGRLAQMELITRKVFRGRVKGERRTKRKGQSVEFEDFRAYVPGDDLRFIDWNLFARLDRLYIKLFLEEEDLHLYLLVDDSPSMRFGQPTKLRSAAQLAAALGYVGLCRGDRVSVQPFSSRRATVLRGRSNASRLVNILDGCDVDRAALGEPDGDTAESPTLAKAVATFLTHNRGKGIVVLATDLMEKSGYESALRMLVGRDMDIFLLHVLAPEELEPKLAGDLRLVDSEDADTRDLSLSTAVMRQYSRTLESYLADVKQFCNRRRIHYVSVRSDQNIERLVAQYLRQRGLLR